MKLLFCISVALSIFILSAEENATYEMSQSVSAYSAVSSYASMLSKAPLLLGQHYISGTTATLGGIGEKLAADSFMTSVLYDSGNWVSLSPRVGSQGLDHIFVKMDSSGGIRGLIVGESKYRTSQLGYTKEDGIQMGKRWINKRLIAMGNRYSRLTEVNQVEKAPYLGNHHEMKVTLKSGKEVSFWRENAQKTWKFSGSESELAEAKKVAESLGKYLKNAGEGRISYRSRIFQIKPDGDDIIVTIRNAEHVDKLRTISKLPKESVLRLSNAMNQRVDNNIVAAELKKHMPHLSNKELGTIAKELGRNVKTLTTRTSGWQITGSLMKTSLFASLLVSGVDVILQFSNNENVDLVRTGITGSSVFAGTMVAQGLNIGFNHWQWSQNVLKILSKQLGVSATTLSSAITSSLGDIAGIALISYGMYFAGYSDLDSANLNFVAGSAGLVAAKATAIGMMAVATTYGVASTGTAISALSGAAAKSAALAWFGGGAASTGAGGMALGSLVVGGVAVVVAVGVSYTVYVVYDAIDSSKDMARLKKLLELLSNADSPEFDRMIQNNRMLDGRN